MGCADVGVAVVLGIASVAASYVPASINPVEALRSE
jgi:hypothetical protein